MVKTVSRKGWGARAPRSRQTVPWSEREEVTLHYSYGPTDQTVRSIQNGHMDGNGWSDIGYNKLVDEDGTAYEGRGWTVVGAHAAPRNVEGIGICYIGRDGMTDAAKRTIIALYDEACELAGRTLARKGHRDVNNTSCPGDGNYDWWKSSDFRDVAGGGGSAPAPKPTKPGTKAPAYPLPAGHWFGPESADRRNHSGYWQVDRPHIRKIRNRLRERGWVGVAAGDRYDAKLAERIRAFQREKGLAPDGLVGPATWPVLWTAPIT